MKNITFKKSLNPQDRTKALSIEQKFEDTECKTKVLKNFFYSVTETKEVAPQVCEPHIYITKQLDTKKQLETFRFNVKGHFYITHNRMLMTINFEHVLDIQINWKTKHFSPKKSVVLTK